MFVIIDISPVAHKMKSVRNMVTSSNCGGAEMGRTYMWDPRSSKTVFRSAQDAFMKGSGTFSGRRGRKISLDPSSVGLVAPWFTSYLLQPRSCYYRMPKHLNKRTI
jgi:hypothetical protein